MSGPALLEATEHQARARVALTAALAQPSHAYLFRGPQGAGKRAAARAFAAEVLAAAADDPEDARRRALLDPSPHPDLVWLAPRGAQHMVEEVRERVIRAAAYRPFEGGKRVFVIEAAEAMRDESQNALLKTLEEPPEFVHLILLSSDQEGLLETVASRCQAVEFASLPAEVLEAELAAEGAAADEVAAAALDGTCATAPWKALLDRAQKAGADTEAEAREALEEEAKAGIKRSAKEITDAAKRAGRRRRTEILDLGFQLCAAWLRDLAAVASGVEEVVFNRDRLEQLRGQAAGLDPAKPRQGAEMVQQTRRGLDLNVNEELALEALFFRLESLLS